jgi:hypothetical protein
VVLTQLITAAPSPPVALVALFREALDCRGIPVTQRLRELLVRGEWVCVPTAWIDSGLQTEP